ncbi:DUF1102 domain-containing protein [Thermococcus sp.]
MTIKLLAGIGLFTIIMSGLFFANLNSEHSIPVVYAISESEATNGTGSIESPVPPYSYLQDGFLKVDISNESPMYPGFGKGLGKDTVYVFEDVFTVKNNESETGESVICVTVTSNSDNIGVFEGNFKGSWNQSISITLLANETAYIGMHINTHNLTLGDYNTAITIEAFGGSCE